MKISHSVIICALVIFGVYIFYPRRESYTVIEHGDANSTNSTSNSNSNSNPKNTSNSPSNTNANSGSNTNANKDTARKPIVNGKLLKETIIDETTQNSVVIHYMYPDITPDNVNGIYLLFHGCSHDGSHWFHLPEEKIIVNHILSNNFIPIALTSQDRGSGCWGGQTEADLVGRVLEKFGQMIQAVVHRLGALPKEKKPLRLKTFGIGASSGGNFVALMANTIVMDGIMIQISAGIEDLALIPTVFIHMPKDSNTATGVGLQVDYLKEKNIAVIANECHPKEVTPTYFAETIERVDEETSKKIFDTLKKGNLLTSLTGNGNALTLKDDPRRSSVYAGLSDNADLTDFIADYFPELEEEMNVIWASHELTSEHFPIMFKWLLSNFKRKNFGKQWQKKAKGKFG